jgi:hypothetical protein
MLAMRLLRITAFSILMWLWIQLAMTTPYLGLPFEPRPAECYQQAHWNGVAFVYTGQSICLE